MLLELGLLENVLELERGILELKLLEFRLLELMLVELELELE